MINERNREYRRKEQILKAQRTRARIAAAYNRNRNIVTRSRKDNSQNRQHVTSTKQSKISRALLARKIPTFYPVQFAQALFTPCDRARKAVRHHVFRKINKLGAGSIALKTMRKLKCSR